MEPRKGRPIGSKVRQNIIEILNYRKKAYGYDIYKDYCALFPKVTLRVIYYNLKKGVALSELVVEVIKTEAGNYSWGGQAEKKYYALGPKAMPRIDKKVKEYFDKKKQ